MHSKRKGNIGQLATAFWFSKKGYSVFTEEGDISTIDLIVEIQISQIKNQLLRLQCKAITPKEGRLILPLKKSAAGYSFVYQEKSFDFFSIYDLEGEKLYLVPSKVLRTNCSSLNLRLERTKNSQQKKVYFAEDFLAERILRDYMVGTTENSEYNEIVQTTCKSS